MYKFPSGYLSVDPWIKACFMDQQHLGNFKKWKISVPTPYLLIQTYILEVSAGDLHVEENFKSAILLKVLPLLVSWRLFIISILYIHKVRIGQNLSTVTLDWLASPL